MTTVEIKQIIDPLPTSDGAGVKLKRSIGVEPNYFDPFLMLDEFGSEIKMIILEVFLLIHIEESKQLPTCFRVSLNTKIVLALKVECLQAMCNG